MSLTTSQNLILETLQILAQSSSSPSATVPIVEAQKSASSQWKKPPPHHIQALLKSMEEKKVNLLFDSQKHSPNSSAENSPKSPTKFHRQIPIENISLPSPIRQWKSGSPLGTDMVDRPDKKRKILSDLPQKYCCRSN